MKKYYAMDSTGWALQFTGSGRSVQCSVGDADRFPTTEAAQAALDLAGENQGDVSWIGVSESEIDGATDADGVETMRDHA